MYTYPTTQNSNAGCGNGALSQQRKILFMHSSIISNRLRVARGNGWGKVSTSNASYHKIHKKSQILLVLHWCSVLLMSTKMQKLIGTKRESYVRFL